MQFILAPAHFSGADSGLRQWGQSKRITTGFLAGRV
jgi:hypothetical protein